MVRPASEEKTGADFNRVTYRVFEISCNIHLCCEENKKTIEGMPAEQAGEDDTMNNATLKKVLIADDNPDLREIFARTFDRRHFDVQVVKDGQEAVDYLQTELPDVLILDVNMPRLNGFEVLRFVRQNQRTKDIKIVLVTGNCMAMQDPTAEFADLLLIKPVNIGDLITLAERLIPARV